MLGARLAVVGVVILAAIAGCRGPSGSGGPEGPPGTPGPFADPPRVESINPGVLSPGLTATVRGTDFAVVGSANRVIVGGWEAEVLFSDATSITIRAAVPPAQTDERLVDLVVVSHNQVSNAFPVRTVPSGAKVELRHAGIGTVRTFATRDDASLFVLEDDRIVESTSDLDLRVFSTGVVKPQARSAIARTDGVYYVSPTTGDVRRVADGADHRAWSLPAGDPRGIAFDAVANMYALVQGTSSAAILRRDYVTFEVTTLATIASADVQGIWQQAGALFVGDVAAGQIVKVPIAAPTPANHAAITTHAIAGDGAATGFLYVFDETTRTVWRVSVAAPNTMTQWSTLTPGPLPIDEIRYGVDASVYLRSGSVIWKQPDAATFTTVVAPFPPGRAVGAVGSSIYIGSDITCGVGDSKGGVLYSVNYDGTLLHTLSDFCGKHAVAFSYFTGRVVYFDALSETLFEVDSVGGIPIPLAVLASGANADFVATALDGTIYVGNWSAGSHRVSKYDAAGTLVAADFVPGEAEAPWSGTVFNGELVLSYPETNRVRSVSIGGGGTPSPYVDPGFRPDAWGISTLESGRLVVTDVAGDSLWAIDMNGSIERLGPSPGESGWFDTGDGRMASADENTFDLVMP